eukprot:COSAG05_NODE_1097_length_5894_cov_2.299741_2_plen_68_part_00
MVCLAAHSQWHPHSVESGTNSFTPSVHAPTPVPSTSGAVVPQRSLSISNEGGQPEALRQELEGTVFC